MGQLVVKAYPTKMFAKLADHTYVECGTGAKGWACWGGKSGGRTLRQAPGSTLRADRIANKDEKAGIKCYLINGVCHQAANRILLPAGITVRGARGSSVSEALFGTYGRVGFWPCNSPFRKHSGVKGDLSECISAGLSSVDKNVKIFTDANQRDWNYTRAVLAMYEQGEVIAGNNKNVSGPVAKNVSVEMGNFHMSLFQLMAEYYMGPLIDRIIVKRILEIRKRAERAIQRGLARLGQKEWSPKDYIAEFEKISQKFQLEMANALTRDQYELLFDMSPDKGVVELADPKIVREIYG